MPQSGAAASRFGKSPDGAARSACGENLHGFHKDCLRNACFASRRHAVHRRITVFRSVHTYRRCRASGISRHGRICSRLGARQLSGTYVHSELPQFSDIRGLISGSMPRYPHTLRPVAFVTVFVCSRLYVFRFRIRKSLNERCRMGVSPFSSHQIP